jgi:nuclear polyadenylated RNA-binding protein 3
VQHKPAAAPKSPPSDDEEQAFTTDEEEEYSQFLNDERDYVTQGQWDRFPSGSRLFIGAHLTL